MKKPTVVFFFFLSLLFSCKSNQQTPAAADTGLESSQLEQRPDRGRAQQALQEMMDQLDLSPKQREQFSTVMTQYFAEMRTIRNNAGGDRTTMRAEMQELRQAWDADLQDLLNKDQYAKFKQLQAERRPSRG